MNNIPIAVGIDSVITSRFESWKTLPDKNLSRIFSSEEIAYARLNKLFFSQRLAVRFAAKEAFLKALQQMYPKKKLHLLTIAKAIEIKKSYQGMPFLKINWEKIIEKEAFQTTLSLTHETCHATAVVIIYKP